MRLLNCDVVVQNWPCSSQAVGGLRKPTRASVSIGRKTSLNMNQESAQETAFLLLCTAKNMNGMKYKIVGNISQIFARFIENGKVTIRFRQPPHELCISKADPLNLRKLLATLKLTSKDLQKLRLPPLTPVKASDVSNVKLSLTINKRSEYPTTTSFPTTLTKLVIVNCGMVRIDVRILALRSLETLDLSNNQIKKIDISFDRLKSLKVLNLSSNRIAVLPSKFCLVTSLRSLDLSMNYLTCLPISFARMSSLVSVKLDNNMLCSLPCNIGDLSQLRTLSVSGNQLTTMPYSLLPMRLNTMDVSNNPFMKTASWYDVVKLDQPSLQECAARMIRKLRIHYDHEMIGRHLCDYLDSGKVCYQCKHYCFDSILYKLIKMVPGTVTDIILSNGQQFIPYETYYCSHACLAASKVVPTCFLVTM